MDKHLYIGVTLALTVYGQLIIKARSLALAPLSGSEGKVAYLIAMFTDVAVFSGLAAAVVASVFWTLAIQRSTLAVAYPFMALSFVLVPLGATFLWGEKLSLMQFSGLVLIVLGVALSALGR